MTSFSPIPKPDYTGHSPKSIHVDGTWEHDRCLVVIDGVKIWLTPRSFKFLAMAAWELKYPSNESSPGWLYKERIEVSPNASRYFYRMKQEIKSAYSSDWKVIENNRLGYYRLIAEPENVTINIDNLRSFPDVEVSGLVKDMVSV